MLTVERVSKNYRLGALGRRELTAVRDVSFQLAPGEVLSLIGESGSGKTTVGRMILRLLDVTSGRITVDGVDVAGLRGAALRDYYRTVQGVFQDPFSTYNPIFKADRVLALVKEQFLDDVPSAAWKEKVERALAAVRLDPGQVLGKYPHQLSGGQLQRMLIARALLLDVKLLVADEIISMLDASTRIDVLNLLAELKRPTGGRPGIGVLFITHDLSLGNYLSERTMIMRRGEVVEMGATDKVLGNPQHPYSRKLVAAVPRLHVRWSELDPALAAGVPAGDCPHHNGAATEDGLVEVEPGHLVACFHDRAAGCPM